MLRIPNRQNLRPSLCHTAFSVQKMPTSVQERCMFYCNEFTLTFQEIFSGFIRILLSLNQKERKIFTKEPYSIQCSKQRKRMNDKKENL